MTLNRNRAVPVPYIYDASFGREGSGSVQQILSGPPAPSTPNSLTRGHHCISPVPLVLSAEHRHMPLVVVIVAKLAPDSGVTGAGGRMSA